MAKIWINYTDHMGTEIEEIFETEERKSQRIAELIGRGINLSSSSVPEVPDESE